MIRRGDVVWVDFGSPRGSEPTKIRPAIVVQDDWLLASKITTALVVPLTSNLGLQAFPGNTLIPAGASALEKDSIAVVSQIGPVDRQFLDPYPVGHLPAYLMVEVEAGIRLVVGL